MRKILYILGLAALVAGCSKAEQEGGMRSVTIGFSRVPYDVSLTKAATVNPNDRDTTVTRLDLYEYDQEGELVDHLVWEDEDGLDLSTITHTTTSPYCEYKHWLALANFDEDSAEYFDQLGADIASMPQGYVPLTAGNFRLHKPLMGGPGSWSFYENGSTTIQLYRYLTRIDIGTVTADFLDAGYMESDVQLKRIVITHAPNFIRPVYNSTSQLYSSSQSVMGTGFLGGTSPCLGGFTRFYTRLNSVVSESSATGTFTRTQYGGTGKLEGSFPFALNYNKGAAAGVLNVDATGDLRMATVHEFGPSEGILCKSDDEDWPHTFTVNRSFYTLPWFRSSYSQVWGESNNQDDTQKMVLEVEVDGELWYYIIQLRQLECDMLYNVANITLKGKGSEFSNYYPREYERQMNPYTVQGWDAITVSNIDLGFTDASGNDIY